MKTWSVHFAKEVIDASGEVKVFWPRIGKAFQQDKRIAVNLDALPMGAWDGRLFLYPEDAS